jgi:hypothetical protein
LSFNGINNYIQARDSNSLDITDDITISVWIKLENIAGTLPILSKGPTSGNYGYYVGTGTHYPPCQANFQLYPEEGTTSFWIDSIETLTDDCWYHIVAVRQGTIGKIYLNGSLDNIGTVFSGNIQTTNYPLEIGTHGFNNYFYNGLLDEIRIYNYALNGTEIQNLYLQYTTPAIVYVDDDYNSSTPGWQYDHFDMIQDGVDAVAENGTVYVYNGTYYEIISISKPGLKLIVEDKNTTNRCKRYWSGFS